MDEIRMGAIALALLRDKRDQLGHLPGELAMVNENPLSRINDSNPELTLTKEDVVDFINTLVQEGVDKESA